MLTENDNYILFLEIIPELFILVNWLTEGMKAHYAKLDCRRKNSYLSPRKAANKIYNMPYILM